MNVIPSKYFISACLGVLTGGHIGVALSTGNLICVLWAFVGFVAICVNSVRR